MRAGNEEPALLLGCAAWWCRQSPVSARHFGAPARRVHRTRQRPTGAREWLSPLQSNKNRAQVPKVTIAVVRARGAPCRSVRPPPQSLTPEAGAYRHRTTQESLTDLVSVYECYLSRARGWCAFSIVPHLRARSPIDRQTHGWVGLTFRSLVQNLSLLGVGDV